MKCRNFINTVILSTNQFAPKSLAKTCFSANDFVNFSIELFSVLIYKVYFILVFGAHNLMETALFIDGSQKWLKAILLDKNNDNNRFPWCTEKVCQNHLQILKCYWLCFLKKIFIFKCGNMNYPFSIVILIYAVIFDSLNLIAFFVLLWNW